MVEKASGCCNIHFFRPLLPGFFKKLTIPTAFVRHIVKEKCSMATATLISPDGESWHVDVCQGSMHSSMYFCGERWLEFVHAHNLGLGYFLVFCYQRNMMFNFRAYDLTSCEISSYASTGVCKEDDKNDKKNKRVFHKVKNISIEKKTSKVKIEDQENFDKSTHTRLIKNSIYKRRVNSQYHERIRRNNWNTGGGKTQYEATICPCNLFKSYMKIPWEFSDTNGLTENKELTLIDPKGKSWHVCLLHRRVRFGNPRNISYISTGWRQFAVAYKLKQGDECTFELVSEGNHRELKFKVQIRRMNFEAAFGN